MLYRLPLAHSPASSRVSVIRTQEGLFTARSIHEVWVAFAKKPLKILYTIFLERELNQS